MKFLKVLLFVFLPSKQYQGLGKKDIAVYKKPQINPSSFKGKDGYPCTQVQHWKAVLRQQSLGGLKIKCQLWDRRGDIIYGQTCDGRCLLLELIRKWSKFQISARHQITVPQCQHRVCMAMQK